MSDVTPAIGHLTRNSPEKSLDRAFLAAYAVALAGSLAVSLLTYVYVGPGVPGVREANPVTASIIDSVGLEGMVVARTAVLIGCYWCYAHLRARMTRPVVAVAFAWVGSALQLFNLAADLRVAALAGPPSLSALAAGVAVVVPALLAGLVLCPPADPLAE